MNIRVFSPALEDWEKVKNLRLEALHNDPAAFGSSYEVESKRTDEEWKEKFQQTQGEFPEEILMVASDVKNFVGMIGAFLKDENTWYIKATYVQSEYRGKGVSDLLMEEMLRRIGQKKEGNRIELFVNVEQPTAVHFYKKHGFEIVDTLTDQLLGDGKRYDEYLMRKEKYDEHL